MMMEQVKDVKVFTEKPDNESSDMKENEANMASMYVSAMEDPNETKDKHNNSKLAGGPSHSGGDVTSLQQKEKSIPSLESSGSETNDDRYNDLRLDLIDREDMYGDYYANVQGGKGLDTQPQWVWVAAGTCCIDSSIGSMLSIGKSGNVVGPAHWFIENTREGSIAASESSLSREAWQENILMVKFLCCVTTILVSF